MKNFKRLFHFRNNLIVYALFLILINLFLIQLPLTGVLGYEISAVNGLIFTLLAGFHSLNFLRRSDYLLKDLFINLLILLFIPFLIIVIKSILTMFCSFYDGLIFYMLIVPTSILFGVSLAFIIDLFFLKLKRTLLVVLIFLIALIPVLEIYFLPQVYFYSPLIGFFPGNIYDEGLSPDWKLFIHQLIIYAFSCFSIFAILKFRLKVKRFKLFFASVILIIVLTFEFTSFYFGFTTTFSKLDSILINKIESKNFCLHYDNISKNEAKFIELNTGYYFAEIFKELKVNPNKQIQVYIFNNRQQKKELFGAGNADVAKPWQYSIYISTDSWEQTLKHELVHIFSAEFGTGVFKIASEFNPALIEGIAEAIEGSTDNYSLDDFSALAFNYNHKIDLTSLFSGFNFFKSNSSVAYTYSGAFIQFLIEKYGIDKVKDFYANGDFNFVFSSDLRIEQQQFENKLKSNSFGNQAMADYYFGRLTILQKVCPRFISDRLALAFEHLDKKEYKESEKLFTEINSKALNYSALFGMSEIYIQQEKVQKAVELLNKNLNKFDRTPYYYNLRFRLADLYSMLDKNDSARFYYESLINENPHHDLVLLSKVRLGLLEKNLLNQYLEADDSVMFEIINKLNDSTYNYNSIPVMINLSQRLKINYEEFIREFNKTFIVNNLESSYAAFKLSQYMLGNLDFANGRKYAALSLRYKDKNSFYKVMNDNYEKANSFYTNIKNVTRLSY